MHVIVVSVVVSMCVFVRQRFMVVFMAVRLGQVQHHASEHQQAAHDH